MDKDLESDFGPRRVPFSNLRDEIDAKFVFRAADDDRRAQVARCKLLKNQLLTLNDLLLVS